MIRLTSLALAAAALTQGYAIAGGACSSAQPVATTVAYNPSKGASDIVDTAVAAGSFKTLAAALQAAGLIETLKGPGPFTVFAPTDEAFAKLPAGTVENLLKPENRQTLIDILTYHVVPGKVGSDAVVTLTNAATVNGQRVDIVAANGKVMVDNANVVKADVWASNGVIHVIDAVIMPSTKDIVQTAVAAGSFKTLAAALEAAGLVSTLQGDGPFTVFAPTDEAFAKLPAGTVENLLKPENLAQLRAVLTYHVVPGRVYADQVVKLTAAPTVQGASAKVSTRAGKVMIDNAAVVKTDIEASNGVIHVIDAVILPPSN
ncbi:MAG: fasciclin domain-containing protein [Phycisphaerales bacterium]|nr:fasciclin domain-containing protein [Phycisphaerales bacterium]